MAEIEERPSKMRKLGSLDGASDVKADEPALFADQIKASEPAIEKPESRMEDTAAANLGSEQLQEASGENQTGESPTIDSATPHISKSQMKKLRKKAEWEAGKDWRKQQKKAKEVAKKAQRAAEKAALLAAGIAPKPVPKAYPANAIQVPITLLLDCDFDEYMMDKEILSLGQQITRSYSDNKHARYRAHLVVSSFRARLKERFETVLASHHLGWRGVTFSEKHFVEAAKDAHDKMVGPEGGRIAGALLGEGQEKDKHNEGEAKTSTGDKGVALEGVAVPVSTPKSVTESGQTTADSVPKSQEQTTAEPPSSTANSTTAVPSKRPSPPKTPQIPIPTTPQLVYLSSDSEHTLDSLSPYTTYIIGGIVDKNRHKGLCHRRAMELGIPTAKLPIGEYMQMQSRTVLATNHVVEIMVNWLEKGDWGDAFLKAIPKRKEAVLRKNGGKHARRGGEEGEGEGEEEEGLQEAVDDEDAVEGGQAKDEGAVEESRGPEVEAVKEAE